MGSRSEGEGRSEEAVIRSVALALAALIACHPATPGTPTSPTKADAGAQTAGPSPHERAKHFVETQLAALSKRDQTAFVASFVPDAFVLGASDDEIGKANPGVIDSVLDLTPHDELEGVKLVRLAAGGNDEAVWIGFEVEVSKIVHEGTYAHEMYIVRGTELLAASAGWKVVAASIARPHEPEMEQPPTSYAGGAKPGPLARLLADPAMAERVLSDDKDAIVFGAGEDLHGSGTGARKLLDKLASPKMQIVRVGREVTNTDWGYAHALLVLPPLDRDPHLPRYELGQVIALPDGKGGWRVVAMQYIAN